MSDVATGDLRTEYRNQFPDRSAELPHAGSGQPQEPTATNVWKQTLKRAHELRRFEIQLFWTRATYFWAFQATAFAFIGLSAKDGSLNNSVAVVGCVLGAITGWVGYLSARGSKFWQENWELHVDLLEDGGGDGPLTKLVLINDVRDAYSVSRLNRTLLLILTVSWFIAFVGFMLAEAFTYITPTLVLSHVLYVRLAATILPCLVVGLIIYFIAILNRTQLNGNYIPHSSIGRPRLFRRSR